MDQKQGCRHDRTVRNSDREPTIVTCSRKLLEPLKVKSDTLSGIPGVWLGPLAYWRVGGSGVAALGGFQSFPSRRANGKVSRRLLLSPKRCHLFYKIGG